MRYFSVYSDCLYNIWSHFLLSGISILIQIITLCWCQLIVRMVKPYPKRNYNPSKYYLTDLQCAGLYGTSNGMNCKRHSCYGEHFYDSDRVRFKQTVVTVCRECGPKNKEAIMFLSTEDSVERLRYSRQHVFQGVSEESVRLAETNLANIR
jgi:hypothetical protein